MQYSEYGNFKYANLGNGKWRLVLPSGFKSTIEAADEDAVKASIDGTVAAMEIMNAAPPDAPPPDPEP